MYGPSGHAIQYRQLRKGLAMPGETYLSVLGVSMCPDLQPACYVYCIFVERQLEALLEI